MEGKSYKVKIGGSVLEQEVIYTGEELFDCHLLPVGHVEILKDGEYQLTICPKEQGVTYQMYLRSVTLTSAEKIKSENENQSEI
jgi:hypothetical protein